MKVKVIKEFHDINNFAHVYSVGEIVDLEDKARAAKWLEHGLAVEEKPKAAKVSKKLDDK